MFKVLLVAGDMAQGVSACHKAQGTRLLISRAHGKSSTVVCICNPQDWGGEGRDRSSSELIAARLAEWMSSRFRERLLPQNKVENT